MHSDTVDYEHNRTAFCPLTCNVCVQYVVAVVMQCVRIVCSGGGDGGDAMCAYSV